ncbi:MAG: hypothetical protein KY455_11420, partial [Euryarchaeota archaeon]|nr:hypothetical protein [Euryarchaeota archaeon]
MIAILVLFGSSLPTSEANDPPLTAEASSGPIAQWKFKEGSGNILQDVTGNGHDGTIHGAQWTTGRSGNGLAFDGIDDFVQLANPETLTPQRFSLEAWARPEKQLYGADNTYTGVLVSWSATDHNAIGRGYHLRFSSGSDPDQQYFNVIKGDGGSSYDGAYDFTPHEIGLWHHVAGTFDGAYLRIYVNGNLQQIEPASSTVDYQNLLGAFIGKFQDNYYGSKGHFHGIIDEAAIYDYALSAEEIKAKALTAPEHAIACVGDSNSEARITWTPAGSFGSGYLVRVQRPGSVEFEDVALVGTTTTTVDITSSGVHTFRVHGWKNFEISNDYAETILDPAGPFCKYMWHDILDDHRLAVTDVPTWETYGWRSIDYPRWFAGGQGTPIEINVNMGDLANMQDVHKRSHYRVDLDIDVRAPQWFDGDGKFDPVSNQGDSGDDPCYLAGGPVVHMYVNGVYADEVRANPKSGCSPSLTCETCPSYSLDSDEAGKGLFLLVPQDLINPGDNTFKFVIRKPSYTTTSAAHDSLLDHYVVRLKSVMVELVAPPVHFLHGWTPAPNPTHEDRPVGWHDDLARRINDYATTRLSQDPWRWSRIDQGQDPFVLFKYDRKQEWRFSSTDLYYDIRDKYASLGFGGDGWLFGHSMGGLVSRWYVEVMGGDTRIEKIAFTATPHTGTRVARDYTDHGCDGEWIPTVGFIGPYDDADGKNLEKSRRFRYDCDDPVSWKPWHDLNVGAYDRISGRDVAADFGLRPDHPPTFFMNDYAFPASGVQYFTVIGDGVKDDGSCLWACTAGDGQVPVKSGTLNWTLPYAVIQKTDDSTNAFKFHESIPAQEQTAIWLARYFLSLDVRTGELSPAGYYPIGNPDDSQYRSPIASHRDGPGASETQDSEDVTTAPPGTRISVDQTAVVFGNQSLENEKTFTFNRKDNGTVAIAVRLTPYDENLVVSLTDPEGGSISSAGQSSVSGSHELVDGFFGPYHLFSLNRSSAGEYQATIRKALSVPNQNETQMNIRVVEIGSTVYGAVGEQSQIIVDEEPLILSYVVNETSGLHVNASVEAHVDIGNETVVVALSESTSAMPEEHVFSASLTRDWTSGSIGLRYVATGAVDGLGEFRRVEASSVSVVSPIEYLVNITSVTPSDPWRGEEVEVHAEVHVLTERAAGNIFVQLYDDE